jgi:hypothetical protein
VETNKKIEIMKKLMFLLVIIFGVGIFTSCEKEEDSMLLSEYVIGEWQSQEMDDMDGVYFLVDIEKDHYTLAMSNGDTTVFIPDAGYSVDNENDVITIDQPQMPGEEPSDGVVSFNVLWSEKSDVMTWTPVEGDDNDAPVLVWTRSTGA